MKLALQAFDPATFAAFGSVVEPPAPKGNADLLAHLGEGGPETAICVKLDTHPAGVLPMQARRMESHPLTEQLFLPIGPARYAIGAALPGPDGAPDLATLKGFLVSGGTGICYRRGVWHLPITILDHASTFLMMMAATGDASVDTAWAELATPLDVGPA
jgi:ureidoglycolate lyase